MSKDPENEAPGSSFVPFADDATVRQVAGFSIENGTRALALHGSLKITRDRAGLYRARALTTLLQNIVACLEADDLPTSVAEDEVAPLTVRNPFA